MWEPSIDAPRRALAAIFLTISEVMEIFRVGRTTAYALAREYIATDGCSGIRLFTLNAGGVSWGP